MILMEALRAIFVHFVHTYFDRNLCFKTENRRLAIQDLDRSLIFSELIVCLFYIYSILKYIQVSMSISIERKKRGRLLLKTSTRRIQA